MGRYQIPFDIHKKMKLLAAASALGLAAAAVPSDWNQFKARFGKTYKSEAEETRRFAIYKENLAFIARHNADAAAGKESYTVGVNHFAASTVSKIAPRGAALPSSSWLTAAARTTPTSARTTTWLATAVGSTTRSTTCS